jgi:TolA-binding protein
LDLQLLIKDNLALDTSEDAIQQFADADLLLYKRDYNAAMEGLNQMLVDFPNHSLTDEIYFLQADIYKKTGRFTKAEERYLSIINNFKQDILTDDAIFSLAQLYEFQLKQPVQAMEMYKKLLIELPGSFYAAEARKNFRRLRGDEF